MLEFLKPPFQPSWQHALVAVVCIGLFMVLRFALWYYKAYSQFPGPPIKNFWIGNLDQTMTLDVHEKWRSWHRTYGPIFQTWNGIFSRVIYVGDPSMISTIANSNWPKAPAQYEGFKYLSGDALFMPKSHEKWQRQRKSLSPAFGPQNINAQYPSLAKYLSQYIGLIDAAAAQDKTVDLSTLHVLLTLDFVGEIGFGNELHALAEGSNCRILQIFEIVLPEFMKCGLFPLRAKVPILKSTRAMHKAISELRSMAARAVTNARQHEGRIASKDKPMKRIYEILVQQREPNGSYTFSPKELCDNYVTFLVAGGDPTAHTLSFAVYEVLRHPEVLAELRRELDEAIPLDTVIPSIESVKLPYLNAVIKETLRYNGPGFGTFRHCSKDTTLQGVTLPANTTLALWNPQVHRDPNLWGEDADEFNPNRWLDPKPRAIPGSYFPFSYGPRNCLGQGLAMLEIAMTLATLFRRYDLSLEEGFEMEFLPSFTLCPKNGLPVRVRHRVV